MAESLLPVGAVVVRVLLAPLLRLASFLGMTERMRREFTVDRHEVTSIVLYEVTGEDMEQLEKETLTVGEDFSFSLALAAFAISFTVTLVTVTIPPSKTYDVFWIVMLVSYIGALFFGFRWFRGRRNFRNVCQKIRSRGGPLGEEGKEKAVETVTSVSTSVSVEKTTNEKTTKAH